MQTGENAASTAIAVGNRLEDIFLRKCAERGIPATLSEDGKSVTIRSRTDGRPLFTIGIDP